MRPDWNTVWIDFATIISKRSYDPHFQVGCCIVTEDNCQVLAVGYNGNHKGGPNIRESEEPGCSGFIHAEINALIKLDYNNPKNKKMYLTLSPYRSCAKAIINGGIKKVFYKSPYRDLSGVELLLQNGVEVLHVRNN